MNPVLEKAWEVARFARHLPDYYRLHRMRQRKLRARNTSPRALYFADDAFLEAPNNAIAFAVWEYFMCTSEGLAEVSMFLRLREGSHHFLDVGAAEGLFSALYSRTARRASRVISIEPIARLFDIAQKTRRDNITNSVTWEVLNVALLDTESTTTLGGGVFAGLFVGAQHIASLDQPIRTMRLSALCDASGFHPDLIKVDIESFEYEVLISALPYLEVHKPRIHLELHRKLLKARGRDPDVLLAALERMYEIVACVPVDYRRADLARIGLVPR